MIVFGLPIWLEYTIVGLLIAYFMFACGKIITKTGRSPAWCLLLFIPFLQIIGLWLFAYAHWPAWKQEESFTVDD